MMGCVNSKTDINEIHPNIFEVMNVDEMGHLISPGQLELTDVELILYQRGKQPTRWPLRCLRKYGFDSEIFSFECGRRCPTGAGIYAFRCRRAELLFNMLQQNIQLRNISDEPVPAYANLATQIVNNSNNVEYPVPAQSTGPVVQRRVPPPPLPQGYLNPSRPHGSVSRPESVSSSNGPISPITPSTLSPPAELPLEHNNNNKQNNLVSLADHSAMASYINVNVTGGPDANSHLYMNVDSNDTSQLLLLRSDSISTTKDLPNNPNAQTDSLDVNVNGSDGEEVKHCYANIDSADLDCLRASFNPNCLEAVPETQNYVPIREVNYAELDLGDGVAALPTPNSPNRLNKSYVTIDFKKTNALSQSVNPSLDIEEGSRKTRHNSTISDVTTRHSNSLSD